MKIYLLLFISLFTFNSNLFGDKRCFEKSLIFKYRFSVANDLIEIDNSYIIVGTRGENGYIVKIDNRGEVLYQISLGYKFFDEFNSIVKINKREFFVAGDTIPKNRNDSQGWLVKIDKEGKLLKRFYYGGEDFDKFNKIVKLKDNNYLLFGYSYQKVSRRVSWILKINQNGEKIFEKKIEVGEDSEIKGGVEVENGYILIGNYFSKNREIFGWIAKIDKNGNIIKIDKKISKYPNRVNSIIKKSENFILTGSINYSKKNWDLYILSIDKNFKKVWDNSFDLLEKDEGVGLVKSLSNDIIVVANSNNVGWIIKIFNNGLKLWEKFFIDVVFNREIVIKNIIRTEDNSFLIVGRKDNNFWFIKVDENGILLD